MLSSIIHHQNFPQALPIVVETKKTTSIRTFERQIFLQEKAAPKLLYFFIFSFFDK
jgi:hypothetical protein